MSSPFESFLLSPIRGLGVYLIGNDAYDMDATVDELLEIFDESWDETGSHYLIFRLHHALFENTTALIPDVGENGPCRLMLLEEWLDSNAVISEDDEKENIPPPCPNVGPTN